MLYGLSLLAMRWERFDGLAFTIDSSFSIIYIRVDDLPERSVYIMLIGVYRASVLTSSLGSGVKSEYCPAET